MIIIAPLPGSPAEKAGLKPKDWIIKIGKDDALDMSVDEAVLKIRGKKGTEVKITVMREGLDEPKEITVVRDKITVLSAQFEEKGHYAYVRIMNFDENVVSFFNQAVDKILAKKIPGVIIDLRNNPGGLLDAAIEMTSGWLKSGQVVVMEELQGGKRTEFKSFKNGVLQNIPTVVLVNEGSASASEILAGALQDYGKAKLVGEKTFGKGSVQELQKLSDGSAVKVTIAKWLTPKGRQIHEVGIPPDFEVKETKDDRDADKDPVLDKAIEVLKGMAK